MFFDRLGCYHSNNVSTCRQGGTCAVAWLDLKRPDHGIALLLLLNISVLVKMERRPFAAGAMRECFALKKLSTFSSSVYR